MAERAATELRVVRAKTKPRADIDALDEASALVCARSDEEPLQGAVNVNCRVFNTERSQDPVLCGVMCE
jgi:hypothetical protein